MAAANNDYDAINLHRNAQDARPGGSRDNGPPICTTHDELVVLFCRPCVTGVCYRCLVEEHNGHELDVYRRAAFRGREERDILGLSIKANIYGLHQGKHLMKRIQESLERKAADARRDIKNYMKRCHVALEKRERDLLQEVSLAKREKNIVLEQQQEDINETIHSLTTSYDRLQNDFPLADPVQQAGVIQEALDELNAARDLDLTPVATDRIRFLADVGRPGWLRANLGSLDIGEAFIIEEGGDAGYNSPEDLDAREDN